MIKIRPKNDLAHIALLPFMILFKKEEVMKIILCLLAVAVAGSAFAGADGAALFKAKMCGACHAAGKKGGDLKDSKMDKASLVKFMKDPKSVNPKVTMPAVKATDEELNALADYVLSLRK